MAAHTGKALGSSASAPEIGSAATRGRQRPIKDNDRVRLERMLNSAKGAGGESKRPPGGAPRAIRGLATAPGPDSPGAGRRSAGAPAEAVARSLSQSLPRVAIERGAASPPAGNRRARDDGRTPRTDRAQQFVRKLLGQDGANEGSLDWRLVQEMDAVDHLVQEDKVRKHALARKQHLKSQLQAQRHEAQNAKLHDREEKRRWGSQMQQDAEHFWEQEQLRRKESMEAQRRFNQEQADHIETTKQRRHEEHERDLEIERQMHDRAVLAKQIEVAREESKKRKQQEAAAQIMVDAKLAAARRSEKRRDEAQRDVEMLRIQQETLERKEQERIAMFEAIRQRQAASDAKHTVNVAVEAQKTQQAADSRTKRQMAEIHQKSKDADEEKQRRLKQAVMEEKVEVERQLEEKSQKRAREREESLRLAQEYQREAKVAKDEEAKKQQERREREKENAKYLLTQMEQKSSLVPGKFGHEQMSEVEKSMNRERLARAKGSDTLHALFRSKQLQFGTVK